MRLKDAWILGVLVADTTLEPRPGDRVVARKDDEAVIQVYREDNNGPCIEAANKAIRKLRLKEAEIIGVVVESRREHR